MKRLLLLLPLVSLALVGCNASEDDKASSDNPSHTTDTGNTSGSSTSEDPGQIEDYQVAKERFDSLCRNYSIVDVYDSFTVTISDSYFDFDTYLYYDSGNFLIDYGEDFSILLEKTETEGTYHYYYSFDGGESFVQSDDFTDYTISDIAAYAYWTCFDIEFEELTFNETKKAYVKANHTEVIEEVTNTYQDVTYRFKDNNIVALEYKEIDEDDDRVDTVSETYSDINSTTVVIPNV